VNQQPTAPAAPDPRRWCALIFLGAAQFMVVLDASIVNVALPSIQSDLHFSQENLQWVVNAYTLAFGGFLLLGGRAADLFGRRRVFIAGLALFSVASLLGGLATSEGWLIAARGVQGLGAAIVSPAALSIVTNTFTEGSERNKALGIWGALAGAGGAVGVLAGGVLTSGLGWEWVLFVNVPIGLGVALAIPRFVDETKLGERTKIDFEGSAHTIVLLAVSVALIAAFVVIEMRHRAPLVPMRIFRNRSVSSADDVGLLVGASLFSMFFFISLYLQQVLGFSALKSGLSYLPLSVGIILAAGAASQLVTRIGPKPVLAAGMAFVAVGLLLFTSVRPNGSFTGDVLLPSVIVAIGLGLSFVPLTIAAVAGVAEHETGLASGLINTAQQVGGALGLAILSTVANSKIESVMRAAHGSPAARRGALAEGFGTAFTVGAGFAIVGVILTLLFVKGTGKVDPAELAGGLQPSSA